MRGRVRWPQSWRKERALACLAIAAVVLVACVPDAPRVPDIIDQINSVDLRARFTRPPEQAGSVPTGPRAATYYGTAAAPMRRVAPTASAGEGFELNFENTPVATVAKVVLGDILGVGYVIDPRVQGTVSLSSSRAVPKSDILFVLESALRLSNVALVRETTGVYRVVPAADTVGGAPVDVAGNPEPGFGITVMPLQFVSAQALGKLADSFVTKAGTLRVDQGRNMVVVQGSGAERRAAVDFVQGFDADWMRGQSVGIYPVQNSTPEPIISELERIMDTGDGGLGQNTVKFQPVGRLNAILVVANKADLLRRAATWITRLDRSDATSTGVRVYRVRYGEARQLARILDDLFTGRSGGGSDASTNQIAPGSGISLTSSGPGAASTIGSGGSGSASPAGLPIAGARVQPGAQSIDSRTAAESAAEARSTRRSGGSGAGVLPDVRITADTTNNALLIYANQENYRIIERALIQLDRPQLQVAIDATIAEVTLNSNVAYGVQALLKSKDLGLGTNNGSIIFNPINASPVLGSVLPGFNFLLGSQVDPRVVIDALRTVTDVKVLSTPSIVVLDKQVANLQVGDQVPIATATATVLTGTGAPVVNTIDYRNTGVILRVVPRINVNGNVLLDVEQEISNVADTSSATTLTPTVSQRKVKSSISVASGQTVILGGLISERRDRSRTGLPFLDQIPAVDEFLSRNSITTTRTEIVIFVRPQIIRDGFDAQHVAEELRAKMGGRISASNQRGRPRVGN